MWAIHKLIGNLIGFFPLKYFFFPDTILCYFDVDKKSDFFKDGSDSIYLNKNKALTIAQGYE